MFDGTNPKVNSSHDTFPKNTNYGKPSWKLQSFESIAASLCTYIKLIDPTIAGDGYLPWIGGFELSL
jgi:hypothetical protein